MSLKVLIAEDSPDVAQSVAFGVRMAWPDARVAVAGNGEDALRRFSEEPADLVVLDVAMPPPDGFEVCRRIREVSDAPILMLTVHDATIDKVRAFDLGADDYLTKPFDHLELLARLRALVRRLRPASDGMDVFQVGDLAIDFSTHQVLRGGEPVRLTATEYRILEELARHAGATMPHHLLLERVWGAEAVYEPGHLKVFIRRLRRKLGDDGDEPWYIQTDWGVGYRMVAPR